MQLKDVSNLDLAYLEGFVEKCAEKGVDAEQFLTLLEKQNAASIAPAMTAALRSPAVAAALNQSQVKRLPNKPVSPPKRTPRWPPTLGLGQDIGSAVYGASHGGARNAIVAAGKARGPDVGPGSFTNGTLATGGDFMSRVQDAFQRVPRQVGRTAYNLLNPQGK